MSKTSRWVAANVGRMAKAQSARLKRMGKVPVPETVQLQRFVDGSEQWRVDTGLVDPLEWKRYQEEMLGKLEV